MASGQRHQLQKLSTIAEWIRSAGLAGQFADIVPAPGAKVLTTAQFLAKCSDSGSETKVFAGRARAFIDLVDTYR